MAVVAVTAQNTRLDDAESANDWGQIVKSPQVESDFKYQNTYSMSTDKGTGGLQGVYLLDGSTHDLSGSGTYTTVIFKVLCYAPGAMDTLANAGEICRVGSATNAYYEYNVNGAETYPPTTSWQIIPIDPNLVGFRTTTTGSPSLTAADYFAHAVTLTGATKIGPQGTDAVDIGAGLTLTGGDGADADGVWEDFVDYDQGTINNRFGYITKPSLLSRIHFVVGTLIVGSATATVFTDSNKVLTFPDGRFAAGFAGIELNLGNASSVITATDSSFVGEGRGAIIQDFHTTNDVDGTNEEVDIVGHGYQTGDYVLYSKQGGTASMGLTDATNYWVRAVTADAIAFYTTHQNCLDDASRVNLTASGTETHRITKVYDTRPDFTVTNTSGSATLDGNSYLQHRNVTFTSAASQDGGRIECKLLTQGSADISNVTVVTSAEPSVACLQDPTFGTTTDLHDVIFEQDSFGVLGHALEIDTAGSYTLTNITFTGYGANSTDQAAIDVTASTGTVTINVVGGNSPTYKTAGATVIIVINPVTASVHVDDNFRVSLQNARVLLEADDATGDFPYMENISITRSGSTATVTHTAHGLSTNDKVVIRGAVEVEYNGVKTITVTGANTYTYTVSGTPSTPATGQRLKTGQDETSYDNSPTTEGTFSGGSGHAVSDVVTISAGLSQIYVTVDAVDGGGAVTQFTIDSRAGWGGIKAGDTLLQTSSDGSGTGFSITVDSDNLTLSSSGVMVYGLTDASGNISASRSFSNDQPTVGWIRKSSASPYFKQQTISGTVDKTSGLSIGVIMISDE